MLNNIKDQTSILKKLGITKLNPMQEEAKSVIAANSNTVLLSPTGTGKTVAFLLPILEQLNPSSKDIQVLIVVPSRELAIQIEQVIREMGTGYKTNAVYGGRAASHDKIDLQHPPAILIGTPGRISDHIRRGNLATYFIKTVVLDEFDKSLEIGFEEEMSEIIESLVSVEKRILTSATKEIEIPEFVGLTDPAEINYLHEKIDHLKIKTVISPSKDKLNTLLDTICHLKGAPGIIFCNFKDTIDRVSDFLYDNGVEHGCFYGGMEQKDRERALIKFRNGTYNIIIATDLAARGLDVPEIKYIIHYHLPNRSQEFTHRNGRTARMNSTGSAFVLKWENEELPEFIIDSEIEELDTAPIPTPSQWETIYISGGRRDKISKGDIAGFLIKQCELTNDQLGVIELKQDCAFVAVDRSKVDHIIDFANDKKLKKRKLRVYSI